VRSLTPRAALAGLVIGLAAAAPARAAPCGRPDLVDMVPPDGAMDVPPNATLAAHYASSADYLGEAVVLESPTPGSMDALPATFDATEGRLWATPPSALAPGGPYVIHWPALRGLNAAAPGTGGTATFFVAATPDAAAPTFDGVTGVRWDLDRSTNDCTDGIEERFVFDVDLGAADDDGGRDGLTLLLFQTSGRPAGDAGGASVQVLARALPAPGTSARVELPTNEAVGRVCFAGLVRDTTGRVSNSADREACVETTAPPFFRGCSIGGGGGGAAPGGAPLALALLVAWAVARRRARPRS
jgi:hypothetical protein